MERLTGRDNVGAYYRHGKESGIHPYADRPPHECTEVIDKLSEYEDTGLTPEEIRDTVKLLEEVTDKYETSIKMHTITTKLLNEYKDAEEQGLLIKLPPDGQIYHIEESEETDECWIGNKPCRYITSEGYYCGWGIAMICFKLDEIGKTVFLTQAEAEQALKEGV